MERKRSRSARTCLEIIRPLAAWIQSEFRTQNRASDSKSLVQADALERRMCCHRATRRTLMAVTALARASSSDHNRWLDQRGLERCLGEKPGR
jgi:hypothetical protein